MRKPFWVAATRSYASPNCGAAVYKGIHIKKQNTGLLLFGDVGTGKSFFAGCIANALLDRDVPVLMTNFPSILNRLERCVPILFSGKKPGFRNALAPGL